jgi:hypothetical protein
VSLKTASSSTSIQVRLTTMMCANMLLLSHWEMFDLADRAIFKFLYMNGIVDDKPEVRFRQ